MKKFLAILLSMVILANLTVSVAFAQETTSDKVKAVYQEMNTKETQEQVGSDSSNQQLLNKETKVKKSDSSIFTKEFLYYMYGVFTGAILIPLAVSVGVVAGHIIRNDINGFTVTFLNKKMFSCNF